MLRWIAIALACATSVIGAMLLWSTAARSQVLHCFPVVVAERTLLELYGEHLIAVALAAGKTVHLYANSDTRTWTMLSIDGRGTACTIISGTSLDSVAPLSDDPAS